MNNSAPPPSELKLQALRTACANHVPLRFAVLHHTGIEIPHFDLLLELPGWEKLLTWRILTPPSIWGAGGELEIGAAPIEDHRPLYLTYEGPLSNDRGHVQRIATGTLHLLALHDHRLELTLSVPLATRISLPL